MRTATAPYTESRLARLVRNKRVGFPVVEHVVNHILEYVSVMFSNVESFALKALVAFNCGLRFNGSIIFNMSAKH